LPAVEPAGFGELFFPPVRRVEIPKAFGKGTRTLGIPTVADRIAQRKVASGVVQFNAPPIG
jgi:RNA-directed DNA polymerase